MQNERRPSVVWLTAAVWAGVVMFAVTHAVLSTSLKQIGVDLKIDEAAKGALATPRSCALAAVALLVGYAADRVGKRRFLVAGMGVIGLSMLLAGASGSYAAMMGSMFVLGMGLGCLEALLSPLVADLHPRNVASHMNVMHAFFPLGLAASSVLIGGALERGVRWPSLFTVSAIPAAVIGAMFLIGRYPRAEAAERREPVAVRTILSNPTFWLLAVAMALTAGGEGALVHWTPNFIQTEYGVGVQVATRGLMVFGAAMAVGRFSAGAAVRFFPLTGMLIVLAGVSAVGGAALAVVPRLPVTLVCLALVGLFSASFWPSILALSSEHIAQGSATLYAMMAVAGIAGFAATPLAVGVVAEHLGMRAGLGLLPACFVAAALALAAAGRHKPN